MIPPVVASDRGRAQTVAVARQERGCRTAKRYCKVERNRLESRTAEGDSPVCVDNYDISVILSNAGHE